MDVLEYVERSGFGFFGSLRGKSIFIDSSSDTFDVERVERKEIGDLIFQTRVRNKSRNPVKIFSFVVAEFKLPKSFVPSKVLENQWLQCSPISYKKPDEVSKKNKIFLLRDQNPFSFEEKYGYLDDSIVSEWYTSLKVGGRSLVIGAVTSAEQFSQIFLKKVGGEMLVRVTSQYDGLRLNPGQSALSEKIIFTFGEEQNALKKFATTLARYMNVKKPGQPPKAMCCSYYWNGNFITDRIINNQLTAIESFSERLKLDYFQIDAGYTKYFGDWLDYKSRFPDGFENIIERIKNLGYIPGIWLSPFAISPLSQTHKRHKNWFLDNDATRDHLKGRKTSPIDNLIDDLDLEVLDPTNEEFQEYLTAVLKHFKNLGFKMFKLDFMYPVCFSLDYSKSITRAKALRMGLETIRKAVGDDAHIVTAITQMSPVVGIADSVRMGIDTLNPQVCSLPGIRELINNYMLNNNLNQNHLRLFFNGTVWIGDPDCLVFRDGTGIDYKKILKHKMFAKENNMSLWIGDSFAKLSSEKKKMVVKFFND